MRFGAGIWLFGQFVDRYAADAYGPEVSTLEAIARAGEVGLPRGARHQLSVLRPGHHRRRGQAGARRRRHRGLVHHPAHLHARVHRRRVHQSRPGRAPPRARRLRGGRRRRQAAGRPHREAVARPGRLRLPVPGRLRRALAARARRRAQRRRDGPRRAGGDRVQVQGAAHAHRVLDRGAHAARHRDDRPRRHRHRRRPRPLAVRQGDARRRAPARRTSTAASTRSRSTTTGASGTTTWPSARCT